MKYFFLSILLVSIAGSAFSQIHNDLCKEGTYPLAPYNFTRNNTGADLQPSEETPGAGNTHWNVVVCAPLRQITVAVSPNYCMGGGSITRPTIRVYDDLEEQKLGLYYNECPKPQPTLGSTTQKLKYEGIRFGNSASVAFYMPAYGGVEPFGNAYYDIQIDGDAPGHYVLAVVEEAQYSVVGNDFVCDAVNLPNGQLVSGSNCLATALADEPIGATWKDNLANNTRWFFFDATSNGSVLELSGLTFDGQIAAYDRGIANQAFCGAGGQAHALLTAVSSADCNSNNSNERLYVPTIAGHRYKIQVDGNNSAGNFNVSWINRDILHPADVTISDRDTVVLHQSHAGSYSTGTLPSGITATPRITANDTSYIFRNTTNQQNTVAIYFSIGCQVVDTIIVTVKPDNTGLVENSPSTSFSIRPNPSKDGLFKLDLVTPATFTVYNAVGQLILEGESEKEALINLSDQSKGTYLLVIQQGEKTYSQSLLRE